MSAVLGPALWLLLGLVLVVGSVALLRANRLDRLHARTDAAAAGLRAALDRRAEVARSIAAALQPGVILSPPSPGVIEDTPGARIIEDILGPRVIEDVPGPGVIEDLPGPGLGAVLMAVADAAEHAGPAEREAAENELTRALGTLPGLPAGLGAELADAEQRLVIARQVYNDAVRDTLALRATRLVRWLRLAGTAAAPHYFEIAEVAPPQPAAVGEPSEISRTVR